VNKVRQIFIWNGREDLGPFTVDGLVEKLEAGAVRPSDYYFEEGMTDWERVRALPLSKRFLATSKQKRMLDEMRVRYDEFLTKADVSSILANQPATAKQLDYLKSFGVMPVAPLTKTQASEMIERCLADPAARERQIQFKAEEFERRQRERETYPSYYLKEDMLSAERELIALKRAHEDKINQVERDRRKLQEFQQQLEKSRDEIQRFELEQKIVLIQENIESIEDETQERLTELKEAEEELLYHQQLRAKFWQATFSDALLDQDDLEDLADYLDMIDRLQSSSRHLKVPTLQQVDTILAALDSTSTDWDKQQPELFYLKYGACFL
jgi:hypothetical protein